jgi:LmbE family N-acetylglucosaminyl deacetylase
MSGVRQQWFLMCVLSVGASAMAAERAVDLLVIAPHPDDEVLLASGVIERAVHAGRKVAVMLMTNGDFTCSRDGYVREEESVKALAELKVTEVYFLGYPDGALAKLSAQPLPPMAHRLPTGQCTTVDHTWADTRVGRIDVHQRRTGAPGPWTSVALVQDLAAVLGNLKPREVFLPHAIDEHDDHSMTYIYFRRAIEQLGWAPELVHRGVVHAGGDCWPSDCVTNFVPNAAMPALPGPLAGYLPDERDPIDARRKLQLLGHYASQLEGPLEQDWLAAFARTDEVFFTERYVRKGTRWVQAGSRPVGPMERQWPRGAFIEWNQWGPEGFEAAGVTPAAAMHAPAAGTSGLEHD